MVSSLSTSRRDASCRAVVAGSYVLTRQGAKPVQVTVFEDPTTSDLIMRSADGCVRIDDLDQDLLFHRVPSVGDLPSVVAAFNCGSDAVEVGMLLAQASELRQTMRVIEDHVNQLLGSETGDGSSLADAVMAAVRDGVGSSIELADLAGRLRR